MAFTHNLGFPRIGAKRELKFALEAYWSGKQSREELEALGFELRKRNWEAERALDLVPVGDFSFYDNVLDMSFTLGNLPERAAGFEGAVLDNLFRIARGRSAPGTGEEISAGEMTKWFDTNYHYIVPELTATSTFTLDASRLVGQFQEAQAAGVKRPKPVILGPVTYLWLAKSSDGSDRLALLPRLLRVYRSLLAALASAGAEWVQIDEPALVTELSPEWQAAYRSAYEALNTGDVKLLVATYFGQLAGNLSLLCNLPVAGFHLDAVNGRADVEEALRCLAPHQVLSLGVINGRNIWKTDLNALLEWLVPAGNALGERLWLAPSCSLLHVPADLSSEAKLDPEVKGWLAFAVQKLEELALLGRALNQGHAAVAEALEDNRRAVAARLASPRLNNPEVRKGLTKINPALGQRRSPYPERAARQAELLQLPSYPTTTIGSFPQVPEIRQVRAEFKSGKRDETSYRTAIKAEIARSIREQEALGLDVLVHGEAERNDMVEYFGEQLDGFVFTQYGWVQSYGSRCVKPPILYGDISRPHAMTVEWIRYAQSLTKKPVKGMLTGPVTILNWSFVRDDQPRRLTCYQLALAIRQEVLALEAAGIPIIQIDEAALREGLPLRRSQWADYLGWAVDAFRIAANGVRDETQIHTHMCYSEFNDIIASIAAMDADVITIETSRSNMELLEAFNHFNYPNQIGPGVYDIHSPNIPAEKEIVALMRRAAQRIPPERLWVNPDCGLKTRRWEEVIPALTNMVSAAKTLRSGGA